MNPIGLMVEIVVFVVCVVFLILLMLFLNFTGLWAWGGHAGVRR